MIVLVGDTHKVEKKIKALGGKFVTGLGIDQLGGIDSGWKVSPEVGRTFRGTGENNIGGNGIFVFRVDGNIKNWQRVRILEQKRVSKCQPTN